ncbi:MAG: hypothetical protein JSS44_05445 [Proteobacteria bacterium]|nr:hypothetical protein [Pseudomonadota bacterium]
MTERGDHPDFTPAQRIALRRLGVTDAQVQCLCNILPELRFPTQPGAAHNDVRRILAEVDKHARALSRNLATLAAGIDAAHAQAHEALRPHLWNLPRMKDETGHTVADWLCWRLDATANAAQMASADIPRGKAARHRTANPRAIEIVAEALVAGWLQDHPPGRVWEFPSEFAVSDNETSTFRQVIRIVFAAAGARNADPLRAIRTRNMTMPRWER